MDLYQARMQQDAAYLAHTIDSCDRRKSSPKHSDGTKNSCGRHSVNMHAILKRSNAEACGTLYSLNHSVCDDPRSASRNVIQRLKRSLAYLSSHETFGRPLCYGNGFQSLEYCLGNAVLLDVDDEQSLSYAPDLEEEYIFTSTESLGLFCFSFSARVVRVRS